MNHLVKRAILTAAAVLFAAGSGWAQQAYPAKPIRFLVPLPPGGAVDIVARTVSNSITERSRWNLVVENRAGANTILMTDMCAKAPPDGYTICLITSSLSLNQYLYTKLPFDYIRDLEPITTLVYPAEGLYLNAAVPVSNLRELVAYAKANPGKINYGSLGIGGSPHLVPEWITRQTGATFTHIPYKGMPDMIQAFMAGDVHMMFVVLGNPNFLEYIRTGKMKVLFMAGDKRNAQVPDAPTMSEAGVPDHGFKSWWGLAAPARTPKDIIARLNAEFAQALHSPAVRERFAPLSIEPVGESPESFAKFLLEDRVRGERLVRASGAKLD